jgi:hypothetical protein
MGILDQQEISQAEKVFAVREDITAKINKLYRKNNKEHKKMFKSIWCNGVTSQDLFTDYGTGAEDLFIVSEKLQDLLLFINPDYEVLVPPCEYIINPDGTVTVGDLIE